MKITELSKDSISELILDERLLVSSIFLYVLRKDPNKSIWPFKKHKRLQDRVFKKILDDQPKSSESSFDVKFMSYNVLLDSLIDGQIRRFLNPENRNSISSLEFGYRFEKIIDEIGRSNSDIIALQEIDHID